MRLHPAARQPSSRQVRSAALRGLSRRLAARGLPVLPWRRAVVGVAVAAGLAGDQDPGHRPVTSQPPTRLRIQRPRPPTSPPRLPGRPSKLSRSTVTISWGRTPPVWGSRPPSKPRRANSASASARRWPPLRVSWASPGGPRLQRRHQALTGLGLQQPVDGHHAVPGRGQPHPPPRMTPLPAVSPLRVSDQLQMTKDPPQPRRVQATAASTSTGSAGDGRGRAAPGCRGPAPQHGPRRSLRRSRPGRSRPAAPGTRPGRSGPAAGRPAPKRSRLRSQPRSTQPAGLAQPRQRPGHRRPPAPAASGPPAGPPAAATPSLLGQDGIGHPVQVLGRQPVHDRCQGRQVVRLARPPAGSTGWSNVCSSPWRQPIQAPPKGKHQHPNWGQLPAPPHQAKQQKGHTGFILPTW